MPTLTRKEVEEIAMLARLHLEADEIDRMQGELGAILEHFAALAQVDTAAVAPMTHVMDVGNPLRVDEAAPSLPVDVALKGVPKKDGNLIVVPAIIPDKGTS
jgi:aspartyl-tRNA(Asn)/glutamyl-tRNA(Gln) amidotransferase subunit C